MAAPPEVDDVMAFLTSRGFSSAAAALRDELLSISSSSSSAASAAVGGFGEEGRPGLPPLRLPSRTGRSAGGRDVGGAAASSSASSDDDFVSMGSTPSEFLNPYGVWSPVRAPSDESMSSRYSEFGTAREDNNFWFGDNFGGYYHDPFVGKDNSGQFRSEDKFITSEDVEERFGKQDRFSFDVEAHGHDGGADAGCEGCNEIYNRPFPICDCCRRLKDKNNVGAAKLVKSPSSAAIYGRYQVLDDHTERLDEYEVNDSHLKGTNLPETLTHESAPFQNSSKLSVGSLFLVPVKELQMLNDSTTDMNSYTNCNPTHESKVMENLQNANITSLNKTSNHELPKADCGMQPFPEKTIRSVSVDSNGLRDTSITEMTKDPKLANVQEEDAVADEVQFNNAFEDELEVFELRIIHRKNRTGFEENKDIPIILNSVIAARYYVTEYLGSAAFSNVIQAHDIVTGMDVCLKIIKNDKEFFDQSLDEIKLLKFVNKYDPADQHHLLRLYDYFYHQEHLFIVTELLRANLYEFQKYNRESGSEEYFTLPRIQAITRQVLEALNFLHGLGIIHCDLKPENILIKSYSRCEIKVIDLGSSCFETDRLCLYVQSRSYRAPEVILGLPYDQKIDLWSLGCILAELYTGDVLFPNDSVPIIFARMIGILGPIDMEMLTLGQETGKYFTEDYDLYHTNEETGQLEYLIPEKSSLSQHLQAPDVLFLDFLSFLLQINPKRRPTASEALQHQWLSITY